MLPLLSHWPSATTGARACGGCEVPLNSCLSGWRLLGRDVLRLLMWDYVIPAYAQHIIDDALVRKVAPPKPKEEGE